MFLWQTSKDYCLAELCSWCLKLDRPWSNTKSILVFKTKHCHFLSLIQLAMHSDDVVNLITPIYLAVGFIVRGLSHIRNGRELVIYILFIAKLLISTIHVNPCIATKMHL